jgi:hypothetical protein
MLNRKIRLTGPDPQKATHIPAASEARVKRERTVDQSDHGFDILAKIREHKRGVDEYARVVLSHFERFPREFDGSATRCFRLCGPAVSDNSHMTERRPGNCWPVMPIDRDCLLEQLLERRLLVRAGRGRRR